MSKSDFRANGRLIYLDLLRVISVSLVLYGHFVSVGGNALSLPDLINPNVVLPLLQTGGKGLNWLENFFQVFLHTQAAVLGVSVFFIITGYLMPKMMLRYTRTEFLANRFFRIFPTLVVACGLIALLLMWTQNIDVSGLSYLASILLIYQIIGVAPVAGVLWTLVVEVAFYFLSAIVGQFTYAKVMLIQLILGLMLLICFYFGGTERYWLLFSVSKYFLMILIGSSIFLAETSVVAWTLKISHIIFSLVVSLLGFWSFKIVYSDVSTYATVGTHFSAVGLFIIFFCLHKLNCLKRTPQVFIHLSELVYPIYLVHVAVGLIAIATLRNHLSNVYLLLISAGLLSIFVSWALHILIEQPFIRLGKRFSDRWRRKKSFDR